MTLATSPYLNQRCRSLEEAMTSPQLDAPLRSEADVLRERIERALLIGRQRFAAAGDAFTAGDINLAAGRAHTGVYRHKKTLDFWEVSVLNTIQRSAGHLQLLTPLKLSLDKARLESDGPPRPLSLSRTMRSESGYPCAAELEWYGPTSIKGSPKG